jgi:8-oxo-dGTP pyrophosphatase MutT (NUDIX family)
MSTDLIRDGILDGVSVVIFNQDNKVLMLLRNSENDSYRSGWEFVKGGLKVGETTILAAIREAGEEIGQNAQLEFVSELPKDYFVDVKYRGKPYQFVHKKTVVLFFKGGTIELSREHTSFKWMIVDEAREICWVEHCSEIVSDAYKSFGIWLDDMLGSAGNPRIDRHLAKD